MSPDRLLRGLRSALAGLALLAGCGGRAPIADEARPLARVAVGERTLLFRATLRGWRHGWSLDPPGMPHDAVYTGWEVIAEGDEATIVRGAVDQVWSCGGLSECRARYEALSIEHCASEHALAFRPGPDEPWRILVPDAAGAGVDLAQGDATASCVAILDAAGPPEVWRRDGTSHPALCAHLYRLDRREDAIRCSLRESARSPAAATRQALPRAPGDPRFDAALLAALAPDAPGDRSGFVPYRVAALVAEMDDSAPIAELARGYEAVEAWLPWQTGLVAAAAARGGDPARAEAVLSRLDGWLQRPETAAAASAHLAISALSGAIPADRAARMRAEASLAPTAPCPVPHRPEPDRCPDPAALLRTLAD